MAAASSLADGFPVWSDAGEIVATSAIVRDITARKATQHALAASEAILRVAFENAPIGMILVSPDGQTLRVNHALCDDARVHRRCASGQRLVGVHPCGGHRRQPGLFMQRALSGEIASYEMEKRYIHRDGHVVWGHLSGSLVRGRRRHAPLLHLPDREYHRIARRPSEALAASEERFRIAFADAPIGMALVAADERVLQANRALCPMLGYYRSGAGRHDAPLHTHPDDIPANQSLVERTLAGEVESFALQKRYLRKDGQIVWAYLTAYLCP